MSDTVEVAPELLIYAFRYALGRMTCAVGDVALIAHRHQLQPGWRELIVRDIEDAIARDQAMRQDVERWQRALEAMVR